MKEYPLDVQLIIVVMISFHENIFLAMVKLSDRLSNMRSKVLDCLTKRTNPIDFVQGVLEDGVMSNFIRQLPAGV